MNMRLLMMTLLALGSGVPTPRDPPRARRPDPEPDPTPPNLTPGFSAIGQAMIDHPERKRFAPTPPEPRQPDPRAAAGMPRERSVRSEGWIGHSIGLQQAAKDAAQAKRDRKAARNLRLQRGA